MTVGKHADHAVMQLVPVLQPPPKLQGPQPAYPSDPNPPL